MKLTIHFLMRSSAFSILPHDGWWLYERQIKSSALFAYTEICYNDEFFSFVYVGIRR